MVILRLKLFGKGFDPSAYEGILADIERDIPDAEIRLAGYRRKYGKEIDEYLANKKNANRSFHWNSSTYSPSPQNGNKNKYIKAALIGGGLIAGLHGLDQATLRSNDRKEQEKINKLLRKNGSNKRYNDVVSETDKEKLKKLNKKILAADSLSNTASIGTIGYHTVKPTSINKFLLSSSLALALSLSANEYSKNKHNEKDKIYKKLSKDIKEGRNI